MKQHHTRINLQSSKILIAGAIAGFTKVAISTADFHRPNDANVVLYAMIGSWMEEDIIASTINNCFANGCSRVYVLDNSSTDNTHKEIKDANGILQEVYTTPYYDDDLRLHKMNIHMKSITEKEKLPCLWWLAIDADEFPCGPGGVPLIRFLQTLDPRYNCAGCYSIDLYPTAGHHYEIGKHPADCMTHAMLRKGYSYCLTHHWKHSLLCYRDGNYNMAQTRGMHRMYVNRIHKQMPRKPAIYDNRFKTPKTFTIPIEPQESFVLFHAPIRGKEYTFKRLEALCSKQANLDGNSRSSLDDMLIKENGARKRWLGLEQIYDEKWSEVEYPHSQRYGRNIIGIAPIPWKAILPHVKNFPRWYTTAKEEPKRISLL